MWGPAFCIDHAPGIRYNKKNEHSPFFKEIRGLYFWIIHEINADFYGLDVYKRQV